MLLCGPLWVIYGPLRSFVGPLRYLDIPDDCLFHKAVGKMRNAELKKGVMETVERWCGTVGKVQNAEICVCRRSFVHS